MAWGGKRAIRAGILLVALVLPVAPSIPRIQAASEARVSVSATPWGVSTCYLGGTEGSAEFDVADLQDAGVNTFRIYGGMQRWEAQDDDGVFGRPTIAEIRADPQVISWDWWDEVMTNPPHGSDYWWAIGEEGLDQVWQGNARTIFQALKDAGIRPVLTLRNSSPENMPEWSRAFNPPRTEEAWNEWWEHVFATVYWLNVRNDYRVDDFEVHNEPDNRSQGWAGTLEDYLEFLRVTRDAIDSVYATYLPGRTYHIYAPVTVGDSAWPWDVLRQSAASFDSVDIHSYAMDVSGYVGTVHRWMDDFGVGDYPLWLSEWGTYTAGYDDPAFCVARVINNLIRGSRPGDSYVYGSHIFSFYDWVGGGPGGGFRGLVGKGGERREAYYAFRLASRALAGCRQTYESLSTSPDLMAITTQDEAGGFWLLVTNNSADAPYRVDADLSALLSGARVSMWEYSAARLDEAVAAPALEAGHLVFTLPSTAAILVHLADPTPPVPPSTGTPVPTSMPTPGPSPTCGLLPLMGMNLLAWAISRSQHKVGGG
jgi:hypothetical protein